MTRGWVALGVAVVVALLVLLGLLLSGPGPSSAVPTANTADATAPALPGSDLPTVSYGEATRSSMERRPQTEPMPAWLRRLYAYDADITQAEAERFFAEYGRTGSNLLVAGLATDEMAYLQEAAEEHSDDLAVLMLVAQLPPGTHDWLGANAPADALQRLAELEPDNGAVRHFQIVYQLRSGDWEGALAGMEAFPRSGYWKGTEAMLNEPLTRLYESDGADELTAKWVAALKLLRNQVRHGITEREAMGLAQQAGGNLETAGLAVLLYTSKLESHRAFLDHRAINDTRLFVARALAEHGPIWKAELAKAIDVDQRLQRGDEIFDRVMPVMTEAEAHSFVEILMRDGSLKTMDWMESIPGQRADWSGEVVKLPPPRWAR